MPPALIFAIAAAGLAAWAAFVKDNPGAPPVPTDASGQPLAVPQVVGQAGSSGGGAGFVSTPAGLVSTPGGEVPVSIQPLPSEHVSPPPASNPMSSPPTVINTPSGPLTLDTSRTLPPGAVGFIPVHYDTNGMVAGSSGIPVDANGKMIGGYNKVMPSPGAPAELVPSAVRTDPF